MKVIGIVVVGLVVSCGLGCGPGEDEFRQDIVDLTGQPPEAVYATIKCAKCHGSDREGQRTAPKLIGLADRWSQDDLVAYLRDPKAVQANNPRLAYLAERYPIEMPAYAHTDEQVLRDLTSWLLAQ